MHSGSGALARCTPCGFGVDLTSPKAFDTLGLLHHEQDLVVTCDLWKRALSPDAHTWDEGIDRGLLCHLLFGVTADAVGRALCLGCLGYVYKFRGAPAKENVSHRRLRGAALLTPSRCRVSPQRSHGPPCGGRRV